jgi:hypothetical protein
MIMTKIEKEAFHGMTPEKAFNKYTEWFRPRADDIEISAPD